MPTTRIQLCGRVSIELEGMRLEAGLPGRQGRLLFVYLAANRMRSVGRDELTGALWPDDVPVAADANLRVILSRLRRLLGADALQGRRDIDLVLPADAWIDLEVAERKIHEAEAAVHVEDWTRGAAAATSDSSTSRRSRRSAVAQRGRVLPMKSNGPGGTPHFGVQASDWWARLAAGAQGGLQPEQNAVEALERQKPF